MAEKAKSEKIVQIINEEAVEKSARVHQPKVSRLTN